jgi:hypothetical protein
MAGFELSTEAAQREEPLLLGPIAENRHLLDKVAADAKIASSSGCRKTAYVSWGVKLQLSARITPAWWGHGAGD